MRDPRNWGRPVAAVVVGGTAAGALVLVRARQRHSSEQAAGLRALEQSLRDVAGDLQTAPGPLGRGRGACSAPAGRRGGEAGAEAGDADQQVEHVVLGR